MANWRNGTNVNRTPAELELAAYTTDSGAALPGLPQALVYPAGALYCRTTDFTVWRSSGASWDQVAPPVAPLAHHASHEPGGGDPMAVDAAAGVGSLRTLGAGAQQATSGTDARLSDARTPTAHASSHLLTGSDWVAGVWPPFHHLSGNYYAPESNTSGTNAPAQGDLRLVPFKVPADGTYDRILCEMTTVGEAGSVVRLCAFAADPDTGAPLQQNPLIDAGTVQTATVTGAKELTINLPLTKGIVWLGAVNQLCPTTPATLRTCTPFGFYPMLANSNGVFMGSGGIWQKTGVTGAVSAWNIGVGTAATVVPKVWLRKA